MRNSEYCELCGGGKMRCGKYKSICFRWIYEHDRGYYEWAKSKKVSGIQLWNPSHTRGILEAYANYEGISVQELLCVLRGHPEIPIRALFYLRRRGEIPTAKIGWRGVERQ